MKTSRRCYRVDRSKISFVKFILEAYDNVAVVSTLDPRQAVIQIIIAPGCETMVNGIMKGLGDNVDVAPVDDAVSDGVVSDIHRWPAEENE